MKFADASAIVEVDEVAVTARASVERIIPVPGVAISRRGDAGDRAGRELERVEGDAVDF